MFPIYTGVVLYKPVPCTARLSMTLSVVFINDVEDDDLDLLPTFYDPYDLNINKKWKVKYF